MGEAGDAGPRRGHLPIRQTKTNAGAGQGVPQRTGLRRPCPDLQLTGSSACVLRAPAAVPAFEAAPGDGNPVNKGPPRPAAGFFYLDEDVLPPGSTL
jgi:hypothetical protein